MHQPVMEDEEVIPVTKPLPKPELDSLQRTVNAYIDYYRSPDCTACFGGTYERDIFEKAVKAFYGEKIFEEINQRHAEANQRRLERQKRTAS